jgi:NitT/TauT family transport system ATP-binding protein
MNDASAILEMRNVTKNFERRGQKVTAIDKLNVRVEAGHFVTIVGPSGCGKTTLLRMAAGLETPSNGEILLDGEPAGGPGPKRGMVFQKFALFPHLTVSQNIDYGLKIKQVPPQARQQIIDRYLGLLGLKDFAKAYPKELSGGMQQRVAIARALVIEPEILLMDEPFAALDAQIRISMQEMLLELVRLTNITTMFVTHSVEEAVYLADKVVVLSQRPAHVARVIDIGRDAHWKKLPVPEAELTPEFGELKREVWGLIRH